MLKKIKGMFPNVAPDRRRFDWTYLNDYLYENPKYKGTKRITHYGKLYFHKMEKMESFMKFSIESE